ncbi:MAG: methylenetetrahydrofolate reductase C-terminal domain-containing protein [Chloroflexota bacterium]
MLITEQKPMDEILRYTDGEKNIFLVGCKGCAEGCETGGEKQVAEMKQGLEKAGKAVSGTSLIDFMCNPQLTRMTLQAHEKKITSSDSLLLLCCGAGVQATASVVDKVVHPGCNTLSLGGRHAEWREAERCLECGQCVLEYTGGICPVARCAKKLFNGPCGGSSDGKCEVSPDLPCAWQQIVDRLTRIGRLDKLETVVPPKDWSVSLTGGPPPIR